MLTIFRKSPTCSDSRFQCYSERLKVKNFLFYSNQSATMMSYVLAFIWHVFRKMANTILTLSKRFCLLAHNHYYNF